MPRAAAASAPAAGSKPARARAPATGVGSPLAGAAKPERPPTPYETRLFELCSAIPPGRVTTYGYMATALASAPRAVGQALRRNPFAPTVPCHRVIAASLELGGFSGSWGAHCASVQRKKALLAGEGVAFSPSTGKLLDRACLMDAAELGEALALARQQPAGK